jgi:UDP-GlcNAc:undecaprenyl-phosphate GlcNAc-1-phosphate transferase
MHHPSLEYALVFCVAAAGSLLLTPLARAFAIAWGAVAAPRDRDVHAVDTPRLGGVALFLGLALAFVVAHELPTLKSTFSQGSEAAGTLLACAVLGILGAFDDRYELDSLTKLAGQVFAAGIMVLVGGVQLLIITVPWGPADGISLGPSLGVPVTIILTVLAINAVNFVDGLDGLAAGVAAIAALAFFAFSYHLAGISYYDVAAAPTLLAAALAGTCIGFLPHNFAPARIFMGDSGSMQVGLVLSAIAVTATTQADPTTLSAFGAIPLALPLLIPLSVLALPLIDLSMAVLRRVRRGKSPFAPDKEHLHHRLMEMGHSHRRAVLLLWFWSALLAFGGVTLSLSSGPWLVAGVIGALAVVGAFLSVVPALRRRRA